MFAIKTKEIDRRQDNLQVIVQMQKNYWLRSRVEREEEKASNMVEANKMVENTSNDGFSQILSVLNAMQIAMADLQNSQQSNQKEIQALRTNMITSSSPASLNEEFGDAEDAGDAMQETYSTANFMEYKMVRFAKVYWQPRRLVSVQSQF